MNEPTVVISGASTGIGRACAVELDRLGFRVFAGVRRAADGDLLRSLTSSRLEPLILDITDSGQIAAARQRVDAAVADSRLAGLVNNAGVAVGSPLEFVPLGEMRRQFEINVFGHIAMVQAFLPLLRQSHGRIVNISSLGGRLPQPLLGPYCASKHALESLSDSLRVELRPWAIEVALVEPGTVRTPMWDKGIADVDKAVRSLPEAAHRLYGTAMARMRSMAIREAAGGVPPEKVAEAVIHALTSRRPRTRYPVGRDARAGIMLARLPDRLRDRLLTRLLKLPTDPDRTAEEPAEIAAPQEAGV